MVLGVAVWVARAPMVYIWVLGLGWLCAAVGSAVVPPLSGVCRGGAFFWFVCGLGMKGLIKKTQVLK